MLDLRNVKGPYLPVDRRLHFQKSANLYIHVKIFTQCGNMKKPTFIWKKTKELRELRELL